MYNRYAASVRIFSLIFSFLILLSGCVFSFSSAAVSNTLYTTDDVNLRSSASSSSPVVKTLSENTAVTLLEDSENGWAYVLAGTGRGYISTDYLQPASGSDVRMQGVTTDDVNFRQGKGTSYTSYGVIDEDTTVDVLDNTDEDWAKAVYNTHTGYIAKSFLKIIFFMGKDTPAPAPSTAPLTQPATEPAEDNLHRNPPSAQTPTVYDSSDTDDILGEDDGVSKLILSSTTLHLNINQSDKLLTFNCDGVPQNSYVRFSSSDSKIAAVDRSGAVRGVSAGSAVITAKHHVTGQTARCTVRVTEAVEPTQRETTAPTQPPTTRPTQPPTQKPTVAPTQPPTQPSVNETLTLSATEAGVYVGCYYHLIAKSNVKVTFSSSDPSIASIDSDGIVTTKKTGSVILTAKTTTKSATCRLGVYNGRRIDISCSAATVTAGKTFFNASTESDVKWVSSDESIASVENGFILGKKQGRAVMSISGSSAGATCLVTVDPADPIRFAYTSPNCVAKNATATLIAITDRTRTAVKFEVGTGSNIKTVNATSKESEDGTYVWMGTTSFSAAGTYPVRAYSMQNGKWQTCSDALTSAFVISSTDYQTTICAERRVSDQCAAFIAQCEGYMPSVYYDYFTGDPTLGYGKLVYQGQQFYNSLTKSEAYAYLIQTLNNDGYGTKTSSFLVNNDVKFNQQQFDSLVCFVYNTGTGVLTADEEVNHAILNCPDGSGSKTVYYISGSYVNFRSGPGINYSVIRTLEYGTIVTILSTSDPNWYYVQLPDGTKGYVCSDYVSKRTTSGSLDLNYVEKQNYVNKICQYHHAGGGCVRGLLNRRIDEMEMFFYGDYDVDYGANNYHFSFACASNPSFHS